MTHKRDDFVGEFEEWDDGEYVDGIGKSLMIKGVGKVAWTFKGDNGTYRTLLVPCYYVPSLDSWIASIRTVLEEYPKETITIKGKQLIMSGSEGVPSITVNYCNGLPYADYDEMIKPKVF